MKLPAMFVSPLVAVALGLFSGSAAQSLPTGNAAGDSPKHDFADNTLSTSFLKYTDGVPDVPVYVMPSNRTLHRFFDTSPISPSGRYLALFRMPYEGRSPAAGDAGEVVLVDLQSGEERVVASSRGWEIQVGANVQWGRSDADLFFNDVDPRTWKAFTIRMDPVTGSRRNLDGTVFMVSPDGSSLASHNLVKSRRVQAGYGVVVPDDRVVKNIGPVSDDGVYLTDAETGQSRLLVSLKTIYEHAVPSIQIPNPEDYEYYCFQVKWNAQGTRLLTTVQWIPLSGGKTRRAVITMNADGTNLRTAITPDQWSRGGHHINWHPNGMQLSMNLNVDDDDSLEFITARFDGSDLRSIFEPGSGHPSFHPDGRYVVTDAYPAEKVAFGNGMVPIRLIDTRTGTCSNIARIYVSATKGEFRLDAHPAWDRSGRRIVFNAFINDTRKVLVADLGQRLKEAPAADPPEPLVVAQRVADHYIASRKVQLHYADLLTLYGLMRLAEVTDRTEYDAFADRTLSELVRRGPASPLSFENYSMGGIPAAYRCVQRRPTGDLAVLKKYVDQLLKEHPRDRQGVFCHPREPGEKIWVDCLMAVCSFLSMSAVALDDPRLHEESIAQYVGMEHALLDRQLGLFHQLKNFGPPGCISVDTWGRGNGWALIGLAELLRYLPQEHPQHQAMVQRLERLMAALEPYQAPSGRWRENLVTPDAYEETSGTGLILYALAMGLRKGWLPESMRPMAEKAWAGLAGTVDAQGAIAGTCVGTRGACGDMLSFYLNRPTQVDDVHAFAPVVLAALEMHLLRTGRANP